MYNLPQDIQTSRMASLFEELEEKDFVEAITLTNTAELLIEVKQANENYLKELTNRSTESELDKEQKRVGENVKEVKVNLEKIMNYLDSVTSISQDKTLQKLLNDLEGIIEELNAKIKGRRSRKDNKEE